MGPGYQSPLRVKFGCQRPIHKHFPELRLLLRKPTLFALLRWSSAGCHEET
jgi:hypothetical protein